MRLVPLFSLALLFGPIAANAQQSSSVSQATATFAEPDERFQHSAPVPNEVVSLLLKTREAKSALEYAPNAETKNVADLFRGVEVHLGDTQEIDMVVLGIPPMRGADNAWFWLVRSAHNSPRIVLFRGGDSLELLSTTTNGYRDVRSRWSSAAGDTRESVFAFDGRKYKLRKETWTRK
jgi:hypothetical protein